jgi:hypothetical protein
MKRIPKAFQLMGHTITVRVVSKRDWEAISDVYDIEDAVGVWSPSDNAIVLLRQSHPQLMHAFTHELTHAILDMMSSRLSHDEIFVDTFGGLLAQAIDTAK